MLLSFLIGFGYIMTGFVTGGRWLEWVHSGCKKGDHCNYEACRNSRGSNGNCKRVVNGGDHCTYLAKVWLLPTALFWAPLFAGIIAFITICKVWKALMWVSLPNFYAKHHPIRTPKPAPVTPVPATMVELHTEVFGYKKPEIIKMIEIENES